MEHGSERRRGVNTAVREYLSRVSLVALLNDRSHTLGFLPFTQFGQRARRDEHRDQERTPAPSGRNRDRPHHCRCDRAGRRERARASRSESGEYRKQRANCRAS